MLGVALSLLVLTGPPPERVGKLNLEIDAPLFDSAREEGLRALLYEHTKNGLRVVLVPDPGKPTVALQVWYRVGSADDPRGISGIAHFFEHLLFKPTKKRTEDFIQAVEARGGDSNAATGMDYTYYKVDLAAADLGWALGVEADRMVNLELHPKMFEAERGVVKNERRMRVDNSPSGLLFETVYQQIYTVHPYGLPGIGYHATIDAIGQADFQTFYKTYYAPNNAVVVIVGGINVEQTLKQVDKAFAKLKPQRITRGRRPAQPPQRGPIRLTLHAQTPSSKVLVLHRAPGVTHADHAALEAVNALLAGGPGSWLHEELVSERKLAAEVQGWLGSFKDPFVYEVLVDMRPGQDPAEAEAAVVKGLEAVANGRVSSKDVRRVKKRLRLALLRSMVDNGDKAAALGEAIVVTGNALDHKRRLMAYEALTAPQLTAAAKKYFTAKARTVAVMMREGAK